VGGQPHIAEPGTQYDEKLVNHGGARPYISGKSPQGWVWNPYVPEPAYITLTAMELEHRNAAAGAVVVNPVVKYGASPNKQWPLPHWQRLIDLTPAVRWVQLGDGTEPVLRGANITFVHTRNFRTACAVLLGARAAVLHEGALHHAAAALGVPAVVLFGGYISPRCTGYAGQLNLFQSHNGHELGCGWRQLCGACQLIMSSIKPRDIAQHLEKLLCKKA
jgi:ADP-heptose:LPS heptosyltransferase